MKKPKRIRIIVRYFTAFTLLFVMFFWVSFIFVVAVNLILPVAGYNYLIQSIK